MSRIDESNRRIASINRVDELNQRTEPQNDAKRSPKTLSRQPKRTKDGPKAPKSGPRSPQDGPEAPQDGPRSPQKPSWDDLGCHLGTIKSQDRNQDRPGQFEETFWLDFGAQHAPQNEPKATRKRDKNQDEKCITFLSLLDPSWTGLEAILGSIWGSNGAQNLGKRKSA